MTYSNSNWNALHIHNIGNSNFENVNSSIFTKTELFFKKKTEKIFENYLIQFLICMEYLNQILIFMRTLHSSESK